jgi:1-deoxy-D-xylulose-5-phosphate reductoisomerase
MPSLSSNRPRRVALLGASGSIGQSTLDVIRALPEQLSLTGFSVHRSVDQLPSLVSTYRPKLVSISGCDVAPKLDCETLTGPNSIPTLASHPEVDVVLSAIVGAAGLEGSLAAIHAGKALALANKETLVVAGPVVMPLVAEKQTLLLPVDSEHSAIFQIIHERGIAEVERVVLTASGGPFRGKQRSDLEQVTPAQALNHPTWKMGPKITIDSATLMNKALEIIEARWLFGLAPEQIKVVIHPESIIHSFVEFRDGSVLAQLSPPDMRLPIQYALTYPDRYPGPTRRLRWSELKSLTFEQPDHATFGSLQLGFEVARRGGTSGAALNAANEVAVARFLAGTLPFLSITEACAEIVARHPFQAYPDLPTLMEVDRWARKEMEHWRT